jgi:hypothetical protein
METFLCFFFFEFSKKKTVVWFELATNCNRLHEGGGLTTLLCVFFFEPHRVKVSNFHVNKKFHEI